MGRYGPWPCKPDRRECHESNDECGALVQHEDVGNVFKQLGR